MTTKKLFITGTGTEVGKTYVTALILKKLQENNKKAAYYKAAMSDNTRSSDGTLIPEDAQYVKTISKIDQPLETMCSYTYETAVSPHLAAKLENNPVNYEKISNDFKYLTETYDYITIEGSGGIICPLRYDSKEIYLTDFIQLNNLHCVIIANAGLGTINSTVLTVEYMKTHGIPMKGIIFNHYEKGNPLHEDNLFMCEKLTGLKVLTCIQEKDCNLTIPFDALESLYK